MLSACSKDKEQAQDSSTSPHITSKQSSHQNTKVTAPDFTLNDLKGGKISLSEYEGQVVLINFWATWCPPCRAEIPEFINVYNDIADKGFAIIGIALDQKDLVSDFVDEFGVNYPIAYGDEDVSLVSMRYRNTMGALPYNVVLDRDHNIVYARPGPVSKSFLLSLVKPLL